MGLTSLIGPAIGLVGSLFGDDSEASQTSTRTPAVMTEDQEKMWDDFMSLLYGGSSQAPSQTPSVPQDDSANIQNAIRNALLKGTQNAEARWEIRQRYPEITTQTPTTQDIPQGTTQDIPSLLQRLIEDVDATKANDSTLVDSLTGNLGTWNDTITGIMNANKGQANAAPMSISLGGKPMFNLTSGSQRYAQGVNSGLASDMLTNQNALAGIINELANLHVPNEAMNKYYDEIKDLTQRTEDRRYGTATQTDTATYNPSIVDTISQWAQVGNEAGNLFKDLFTQGSSVPSVPSDFDWLSFHG